MLRIDPQAEEKIPILMMKPTSSQLEFSGARPSNLKDTAVDQKTLNPAAAPTIVQRLSKYWWAIEVRLKPM